MDARHERFCDTTMQSGPNTKKPRRLHRGSHRGILFSDRSDKQSLGRPLFCCGHFRVHPTIRLQTSDQFFGRLVTDALTWLGDGISAIDTFG